MPVHFPSLQHGRSFPDISVTSSSRIGTEYWREGSVKEIKLSDDNRCRSDNDTEREKQVINNLLDRDNLSKISNAEAQRYFRDVRLVVHVLREKIVDVNEELKLMIRIRDGLEREHELLLRDIAINRESQRIRCLKPQREKLYTDGADDLLEAESVHLLNLKQLIRTQLLSVRGAIQALLQARGRLTNVSRERSVALELVCHAVPVSGSKKSGYAKRYSLPPRSSSRSVHSSLHSTDSMFPVDNLGPYSTEVCSALQAAQDTLNECTCVRKDSSLLLGKCQRVQRSAHDSVQSGLNQKLVETETLKRHLMEASTETQRALNRAQKFYDGAQNVWCHYKGPHSARDVTVRERLDRPLIKVSQRHPGAVSLNEREEIAKTDQELLNVLRATGHRIGELKLSREHLKSDIGDKRAGYNVDKNLMKLRQSNVALRNSLQPKSDLIVRSVESTAQ